MKSKQTMFFAVLEDIGQILQDVEENINLSYYKAGLFDTAITPIYNSVFNAPNLGTVSSGDWNKIDHYMLLKENITLNFRPVPQKIGGVKFAVDQMNNPGSIELKLGGIFKENIIVAGRVATISDHPDSLELYKLFSGKIKKKFKKIGAFYVGRTAAEKLNEGWRLVTNEKSPEEYDLVEDGK